MNRVIANPLTKEDFAPFGEVFDTSQFNGSAFVQETFIATDDAKRPVMQMVRVENVAQELTIRQLETHPFSSQTFLALDQCASLVIVCEPDASGRPDVATLRAFVAAPHQVVTYRRNVLHHKLTPLKAPATFAMTMCQTGVGADTIMHDLPQAVTIDIASAS